MTPAEMREAAAVLVEERPIRLMTEAEAHEARASLAAAIRALPLAEEAPPSLAAVLSALPHLTGDELRRVAEAMPRVAGEWTEVGSEGSRFIGDDWTVAHVCNLGNDKRPCWEARLDPEIDEAEPSTHPTARAAQAACDARLEAAGVRLCGERVREEGT